MWNSLVFIFDFLRAKLTPRKPKKIYDASDLSIFHEDHFEFFRKHE